MFYSKSEAISFAVAFLALSMVPLCFYLVLQGSPLAVVPLFLFPILTCISSR